MTYTPEQFAKLPKWAQSEIKVLQMRVTEHRAMLAGTLPSETDTWISRFTVPSAPLEQHERIAYRLDALGMNEDYASSSTVLEAYVRGNRPDAHLEVTTQGGEALIVQPVSSNVIRIKQGKWWK